MTKKNLMGNDKLLGRPMKLNRQRLETKDSKPYAELVFMGDVHYGSENCDVQRFLKMIDYCLKNRIYVLFMGDMLEMSTRYSIGSGVYHQSNPQVQYEEMVDMIRPLVEAGLVVGYHSGNHEDRIAKETGIDVTKMICRELKMPYLGGAGWSLFYVGDQSYSLYTMHGSAGSRFNHTKLKAAMDISHYFEADIVAYAHVHNMLTDSVERQRVNRTRKIVEIRKCHVIVTGHYLMYENSYAQDKGLPPSKLGSPKVKLWGDKWDIHVSI